MKTLCKIKNVEKHLKSIVKAVAKPRYVCGKCGKERSLLCQPMRIVRKTRE